MTSDNKLCKNKLRENLGLSSLFIFKFKLAEKKKTRANKCYSDKLK